MKKSERTGYDSRLKQKYPLPELSESRRETPPSSRLPTSEPERTMTCWACDRVYPISKPECPSCGSAKVEPDEDE